MSDYLDTKQVELFKEIFPPEKFDILIDEIIYKVINERDDKKLYDHDEGTSEDKAAAVADHKVEQASKLITNLIYDAMPGEKLKTKDVKIFDFKGQKYSFDKNVIAKFSENFSNDLN